MEICAPFSYMFHSWVLRSVNRALTSEVEVENLIKCYSVTYYLVKNWFME